MAVGLGRLVSADGAVFSLIPVPDLASLSREDGCLLVDVELLTPDRLVRYLARTVSHQFLSRLAATYLDAAQMLYPVHSVATVEEERAGLGVSVMGSTPFLVELEVIIDTDLEADISEPDAVSFNVARTTSLITAAHEIRDWLGPDAAAEVMS